MGVFLNCNMTVCDGLLGVSEIHDLDSGVLRKECGTEMALLLWQPRLIERLRVNFLFGWSTECVRGS